MQSLMILMLTTLVLPSRCNEYEDEEETQVDHVDPERNCTNKPCVSDEEYLDMMYQYIKPQSYEWLLICMHIFVFVIGLVGNALVCLAVYRNHSMRTVTNYFIVNLALADLLVIIVCLPPTIVWDITETWFLGELPCKVVLYLQEGLESNNTTRQQVMKIKKANLKPISSALTKTRTLHAQVVDFHMSVTVSVLTLTFISVDRWYAICFPLSFKSTTSRAKTAICIIWAIALVFDIPELIVMTTKRDTAKHYASLTMLFTQCSPSWSMSMQKTFTIAKLLGLYTLPLTFMSFAYCQIIRVLWRNDIPGHNLSTRIINPSDLSSQASVGNPEGQLKSRRKAAKMLVAVVLMFAICCFPVHFLSILRENVNIQPTPFNNAMSCLVHWLFYANSAINPLIYNFMSGKFRTEFKRTFCCPGNGVSGDRRGTVYRMAGTSQNYYAYYHKYPRSVVHQLNLYNNNNIRHSTECLPLSSTICSSAHHPTHNYSKHR